MVQQEFNLVKVGICKLIHYVKKKMKISLYPTPIVALATFSGFWSSKKLGRHATDHQDGQSIMFVLF